MKNVKKDIIEIIRNCEVAFLATINLDNFPETRALINVLNREINDVLEIYFVSDANAPKFVQLKKNSSASLYYYLTESMKNMILFGKLELVADKSLKDKLWRNDFLPHFKNGKNDESYGLFRRDTNTTPTKPQVPGKMKESFKITPLMFAACDLHLILCV
ncbi:MAG: pyridoxamine 5'-phosphate oxidase family protein [Puniceicoccales bacterium]|jgi:general stress protein 26|nr:pyridoxamine 5'-phosphate oxidase family protein [Puniceicoccales bacterium]